MRMGLREANQNFAKAIRAVRAGKEVILTDRGTPIAVISPLREVDRFLVNLRRLLAEGRVTGRFPPRRVDLSAWKRIELEGQPMSRSLIEERRDRRI